MGKRYIIWDKQSDVYTPSGEVLTAVNWLNRYPVLKLENKVPLLSAGLYNGAYCGELYDLKRMSENNGATFEEGLTDEELLDAIEAFEESLRVTSVSTEPSDTERIAAALEAQVMMSMPDEEV